MVWEAPVTSFARGVLTRDRILIPGKDLITELDPLTGKVVRTVSAETVDDQPIGNLYTDGSRLYAIGLRRVYCYQPQLEK